MSNSAKSLEAPCGTLWEEDPKIHLRTTFLSWGTEISHNFVGGVTHPLGSLQPVAGFH